MPVVGSYKGNIAFARVRIAAMSRDTVSDSVDKLQEQVRSFTPVDSRVLWKSVSTKGTKRVGPYTWQGEVYSDLEYAAAIEYGMSPKFIRPKKRQALNWSGAAGVEIFSRGHQWPGYQGHHMFQRGAAAFERLHAEDIAERNARLWLGSVDAGRRTIVI